MKKFIYLLVISVFVMSSCCNESAKKESDEASTQEDIVVEEIIASGEDAVTEEENAEVELDECDEFLNEYDAWIDNYLEVLEMFKKDPTNPALSQKFRKLGEEVPTWTEKWLEFAECSNEEKYQQRYDEIQEHIDNKMKELGM